MLFNHAHKSIYRNQTRDTLLNPELLVPPRPKISNIQWISGTQYVTPADMDLLSKWPVSPVLIPPVTDHMLVVGGPDRPPSKRMLAQARADEEQRRREGRAGGAAAASSAAAGGQEGWGAWATRQLNERTEKLNLVGDSMDNLQQNSAGWADDVNKFVAKQKRGMVMGAVKSKFGF